MVEVIGKETIEQVLQKAHINPQTVIVRQGKTIVPDSLLVRGRQVLEAIAVVSGG